MKPSLCLLSIVLLVGASRANEPGGADPRLKGYKTSDDIGVQVVAEDPVVVHPVGLTFSDEGVLYVLETRPAPAASSDKTATFTYKDGSKRSWIMCAKGAPAVVKALSDSKGKGVFDQSKIVFEDEAITDILFYDGWLYVAGQGMVRRCKQSKLDGPYDVKEVVAQGFFGPVARQVCGMAIGPDGRLYISATEGDNIVEGSDGSRATVLRSGAIFRCWPDGSQMETFALGFIGPNGGVAFDAAGNAFHSDEGLRGKDVPFAGCRLMHIVEGADFGWRSLAGKFQSVDAHRAIPAGDLPGKLAPMLQKDAAGSGGLLVYDDTGLPNNLRGQLFQVDPLRAVLSAYKVERKGATFTAAEPVDVLKSDDPLFKPRQIVLGPDGALYVADSRDAKHGRILRLGGPRPADLSDRIPRGMDYWARIAKLGDEDLVRCLHSSDGADRDPARRELVRRGEKEREALLKLFNDAEQPDLARIAALGVLESMWNADVQKSALVVLLKDSSADLRRLAADAVGLNADKGDAGVHSVLLRALTDAAPEVRRSAALAMSRVAADGAPDNLVNTWSFDEGRDPYLRDGLVRAIENLGAPGVERLIALGESGVQKDTDKVAEALAMMRARPAADAIPRALENPHLNNAQRAALIRSYENYLLDPPVSLAPAVEYLSTHPDANTAVKQAGLEVLTTAAAPVGAKAVPWLLNMMLEKDPKLVTCAVNLLAASEISADEARRVGQSFLDGKLPTETRPQVVQILKRHVEKDAESAKLLTDVMKGGK